MQSSRVKYRFFQEVTMGKFDNDLNLPRILEIYSTFMNNFSNHTKVATDIQKWCKVNKASGRVLKLYGSNSILYMIDDYSITKETYIKLYRCMFSLVLEMHGFPKLVEEKVQQRKKLEEFINYFGDKDKTILNDFDSFIGEQNYVGRVFCGMSNLSSQKYELFTRYKAMK
jgi:hypothetical protein